VSLRHLLPVLLLSVSAASQSSHSVACRKIELTSELSAGQSFERKISAGLSFHVESAALDAKGRSNGWAIRLTDLADKDDEYIYPVNPPLRFNGLQTLGPGYGNDAKASLSQAHEMRFLLDAADYKRLWPLVTNALWPYSAPRPDTADEEYSGALASMTTGLLKLTVTSYVIEPGTDLIRDIEFRAEFWAPQNFAFDPGLKPLPAECPAPQ
jgi:hypothetical protein